MLLLSLSFGEVIAPSKLINQNGKLNNSVLFLNTHYMINNKGFQDSIENVHFIVRWKLRLCHLGWLNINIRPSSKLHIRDF